MVLDLFVSFHIPIVTRSGCLIQLLRLTSLSIIIRTRVKKQMLRYRAIKRDGYITKGEGERKDSTYAGNDGCTDVILVMVVSDYDARIL